MAPLLFCIFTCWFSDIMDDRLGQTWSADHHRAFADDNLVQWTIRSEQDMSQMCHHIRVLFTVLREVGMSVNVLKSGLLIRVHRALPLKNGCVDTSGTLLKERSLTLAPRVCAC